MNGRDYIISGSCDEHIVRICCAQTGRRLRDISLEVCQLSNLLNWQPSLINIIHNGRDYREREGGGNN